PVRPVGPRPVQRPCDALGREAVRPALHPAAGGYLRRRASAVRRARSGAGRHPALQRRTRRRSGAGRLQCGRGLRPADRRHPGLSGTAARRRDRRGRRRGRAAAGEPAANHQPALSLARVGIAVRVLPPLRLGRDDRPGGAAGLLLLDALAGASAGRGRRQGDCLMTGWLQSLGARTPEEAARRRFGLWSLVMFLLLLPPWWLWGADLATAALRPLASLVFPIFGLSGEIITRADGGWGVGTRLNSDGAPVVYE